MTTKRASALIKAAAPEAAVPLSVVEAIVERRRAPVADRQPGGPIPVVTIEPKAIEYRPGSVRVVRRGGVQIVVVRQPKGLTGKEAIEASGLGLLVAGTYFAVKDAEKAIKKLSAPSSNPLTVLNPLTWRVP